MSLENACAQDASTDLESTPCTNLVDCAGPNLTNSDTTSNTNTRPDVTRDGFPSLRLSSSDPMRDGTYSTQYLPDSQPRNYYASAQDGQSGPYGQRPGPRPRPNRPDNPPQPRPDNPPQPRPDNPTPNPNPFTPLPRPTDNRPADGRPQGDRPVSPTPAPGNNFTPQQISDILRMRDRALDLNRTQPQTRPGETTPDIRPIRPNGPNGPTDRVEKTSFATNEVDQAIEAAKRSGRPLVVKVGFPGCPGCDRMTSGSWPQVQQDLQRNAIFLDVNVNADASAGQRFPATSYPTVLVYNVADGTLNENNIVSRGSFMNANRLRTFLSDAYQRHSR